MITGPQLEVVTTTQAIALWLTRHNGRRHNEARARMLAEEMRAGRFRANEGRPVRIVDGRLGNGQHRVRAIVLSGEPQLLNIVRVRS